MSRDVLVAWDVQIRTAIGNDTAEHLRESAAINENDFEVGSGIANCQRRYANLIELAFEMGRAISDGTPKWIPVSERMPGLGAHVLLTSGAQPYIGFRYIGQWWNRDTDGNCAPTHWMPLPEAPK